MNLNNVQTTDLEGLDERNRLVILNVSRKHRAMMETNHRKYRRGKGSVERRSEAIPSNMGPRVKFPIGPAMTSLDRNAQLQI